MDLATIGDLLGDFATFGKNIGTALGGIPTALTNIIDFFQDFGDNADTTSSLLGSSTADDADTAGVAAESSLPGSSVEAEAEVTE